MERYLWLFYKNDIEYICIGDKKMRKEEKSEKEKEGVVKVVVGEVRDSILLEVAGEIILFIPKMIIRFIRHLY